MTTLSRYFGDKVNTLVAAWVFLFSLVVYTITMNPSVPFWDSGEYIATSYILGIPHAPGTPLYVLIGRIFTLLPLPFWSIAEKVNWLSALMSAVTVLFTYLITVKVTRRVFPWEASDVNRAAGYMAGVVAAFIAGFATTFWDNAVEAEVYAAACAIMTFAVWLILRWEERLGEGNEDGLLLVITYLVGLGVGIHLGVAISAFAAVAFVFVCRPKYLTQWNYIGWAIATLSLGAGVNTMTFLWAPLVLAITLILYLLTGRLAKLALWSSLLFMFGVSVHLFLIIRSNMDPAINEAAPKTWYDLWLMLIRDQYKPGSPLDRRAPWDYQFGWMYWRYMTWNFTLFTAKARDFFHLPLLLALVGSIIHIFRHRRSAVILWVLFVFLGPIMVFYLNFKDPEVRERDYFYVQNFQFLAIWVGLGAAWVIDTLRRSVASAGAGRALASVGIACFLVMSILPLAFGMDNDNFHRHDRRGFLVAHNYAYNMLGPLEENSFIFTNGDNDTFPLWYIQEVEGYRKDVRVVNLSLLNTGWYIRQLRDIEPTVPIAWTDQEIDALMPFRDRDGRIVMVKDLAVRHILEQNDWKRQPYLAVTVPDQMGLTKQLTMEGLVFRIEKTAARQDIDVEKTRRNLHEFFRYDGLLTRSAAGEGTIGVHDTDVYKDDNATRLTQNYAAAFSRLSIALFDQGDIQGALREIENARQVSPTFPNIALAKGYMLERLERWPEAEAHYRETVERFPREWQIRQRLAAVLIQQDRWSDAIPVFESAVQMAPGEWDVYQGLLTVYYNLGDYANAADVVRRWLLLHPQDQAVRRLYDQLQNSARTGRPISEGEGQGGASDTSGGTEGQ